MNAPTLSSLEQLYCMVYISRITSFGLMGSSTLNNIAEVSTQNNLENNITGILCYGDGYFFQYIEGNEQAITNLKNDLLLDPRHQNVNIICFEEVEERLFDNWSLQSVMLESWFINKHSDLNAALPFKPDTWQGEEWRDLVALLKNYHAKQEKLQEKPLEYNTLGLALTQIVGDHRALFAMQVMLLCLVMTSVVLLTLIVV